MSDITALVDALIGPIVAMLLTVMVLSYLIGDNPLFRIASHLFIGVAAGYACALATILFSIILAFTALIFRTAQSWVYYEYEG